MNDFEKACIEEDANYESEIENVIEFLRGSKVATVTFTQGRYISKVEKLAMKFPDEVEIVYRNYNREGNVSSIVAHIPVSYIHISNFKREITDEERETMRDRLNMYRQTTAE